VRGDPDQLGQTVAHLIVNACEALPEEKGVVSIDVSAATMSAGTLDQYGRITNSKLAEGQYSLIQVADNGTGMSQQSREKMFEPFYTTKFLGRGLGLPAVLGIIRSHHGGVLVESIEGKGTTVHVLLPMEHERQRA
jgi:signal transduction histidine kinase